MDLRIRPLLAPDEMRAFERTRALAFGDPGDHHPDGLADVAEFDRMLVAEDAGLIVGTAAAFSFSVSLPGGADLPTAGLKALAVRPTHRRRGVLRALLGRLLGDAHDRGDAAAVLWASESGIYHRFGFGMATTSMGWEAPAGAAFLPDPARLAVGCPITVRDRHDDPDETLALVAPVHEHARARRPGMIARSNVWWRRRGLGGCTWAIVGGDTPSAYAAYDVEARWADTGPDNQIVVREAIATNPAAEAGLWRFLLDLDLARRVRVPMRPPDDAIVEMIQDARSVQRRLSDGAWLRILDVPAALTGRAYGSAGTLTVEVVDEGCPWNAGTWTLDTDGHDATCARTNRAPDLTLNVAELSAALLGGSSLATMASAGLVAEGRPGAAFAAHRLLSWPVAPWSGTYF